MQFLSHWTDNGENALLITSWFSRRERGQEFPLMLSESGWFLWFLTITASSSGITCWGINTKWEKKARASHQCLDLISHSATTWNAGKHLSRNATTDQPDGLTREKQLWSAGTGVKNLFDTEKRSNLCYPLKGACHTASSRCIMSAAVSCHRMAAKGRHIFSWINC